MLPAYLPGVRGLLGVAAGVYVSAGWTCQEANKYFKKASGMFYWTHTRRSTSYDSCVCHPASVQINDAFLELHLCRNCKVKQVMLKINDKYVQ